MKRIICLLLTFIMIVSTTTLVFASEESSESGEKYVYRDDTYDFEMMSDPMDVTDEEFFGVWDSDTESWVIESWFKYDEFPEMSKVEAAVKNGDYDLAKDELRKYYISRKDVIYNQSGSTVNNADRLQADLQARNMYAATTTGTPIEIIQGVNGQWQVLSSKDVLAHVKTAVASGNPYVSFVIASMDKSNTAAEIKGKGTDAPPTLTLVVNRVAQTFPIYEDSYISAGRNANTNYGDEEILYAQEYGYVGHWASAFNPWGDEASDTKRAYIKFDISSLVPTDTVSTAELNFTARVADGGDLTEKELFVYGWEDASWKESTITWNTFTDWLFFSCNDQEAWDFYSNPLSEKKGKLCYFWRGTLLRSVALMYDNTKDEKYAYTFIRQMMSCINHVGANKCGKDNNYDNSDKNPDPYRGMSHLDIGGYTTQLPNGFVLVWESQVFEDDPSLFVAMLKNFIEVADYMCEHIVEKEVVTGNMATSWNRSLYLLCNLFPEIKQTDYYYDLVLYHNKRMLETIVYDDGACFTASFNYIGTELGPFTTQLTYYNETEDKHFGLPYDDEAVQKIYAMVKNWLYSTSPGWGGYSFADSIDHGKTFVSEFRTRYNQLVNMGIDDEELKYVATNGVQGKLPDFTSISFPVAKRTYMRTDWGKNAVTLAMNAKGDNTSHRHNDQMSVVVTAYGRELLVDPAYASILTDDKYKIVKAGDHHNTITVNGGNIYGSTGQDSIVKGVEHNNLYDYVTYTYDYVQNASHMERSVLFPKNQKFFIIADYIMAEDNTKENVFTQNWHMLPAANVYISESGELRSDFETGANIILSPVDTEGMSDIYLKDSYFCPTTGSYLDNKKGVYERESTDSVKYGTVIYPLEGGQDRQIETDVIDLPITDNGATAFRIRITDPATNITESYYYYHLFDLNQKQEVTLGKYKTDATTMLVHEDMSGKVLDFFVHNGSYIERSDIKDKYLFKSANGNKTISVNFPAGNFAELASDSMETEELKDVTVYAGFNTSASTFNGERIIDTKKDGAYVYYGDTPVVESTETAPEGTDEDDGFGDFTGGSGSSSGGSSGGSGGSSGGSGSGGSGGTGGGSYVPPVEDNKADETAKEDEPVEQKPEVITYNDVSESDWYYEFVQELTEKEIVSGDGTGSFAPNSNVTREQFLKMLMISAAIETDEAENTFDDVANDAWYKEYVLKAKNYGIVNGVSDTEFGIGSNITRQDMAVMITRVIEKLAVDVEKTETEAFADDSKVSDYAKESVKLMKSIGLIEGYNNEFRPTDNLTRAEAAKIISCLLNLLK